MKILHVVPSYLPAVRYGGTIASVHGLCKALAAQGHDVHVFTTNVDGPLDAPVPIEEPVTIDGVSVWYFRSPRLRRLFRAPGMKRALRERVGGFDVVHLHSIFLWPTWAAAREARRSGVPYALSPRGMLERGLVRRRSRWVKSAWLGLVERGNLEGAAVVHFTSERERREAGRFGYRFRREAVIPNGVDCPPQRAAAESAASPEVREALAGRSRYFLFLGRISWKKGLDRLMRSLPLAPEERLVVAGNDDEGYWPQVERLVGELGLADRVRFVGAVRGEEKRHLLENALALVLPSYSENFGNVVLEAMAVGCPVIVTPEVGAAEIVEQEGAGMVVDGEPSVLGAAMKALAQDRAGRLLMIENGRTAAASRSWAAAALQMSRLYSSLDPGQ